MSKTVVVDEAYRDRQTANQFNAAFRHCRIGKVTMKRRQPNPFRHIRPIKPTWPFSFEETNPPFADTEWKQMFMDKCGCRVGTACGNVACPHRLAATC